jgi:hypothetical protein
MAGPIDGLSLLFGEDEEQKAIPVQGGKGVGNFAAPGLAPKTPDASLNGMDLLFGQEEQAKPPTPKDKDLTYDYDKTLGFKQQAVGSFASDDKEWLRYAAKELYPDEPLEQAFKRFGKTEEGRYFHKGDDGRLYEVQPPKGLARAANIGGGVGHMLPIGAGTATAVGTSPMSMGGPLGLGGAVALTGGAAAGGEALRQKIGDHLLGEASTNELNPWTVTKEGVTQGLGQGVGAGLASWVGRYAAPDIGRYSAQQAQRLYDLADQHGVRLTPAEATGLASQVAEQKRLAGIPQSANQMKDFARERNQEVVTAWDNFLNTVGPPRDAARVGEAARTVADDAVTAAQGQRTAAATPFYRQAEQEIAYVNPGAAHQYIEQELPTAKGSIRRALEIAQRELRVNGAEASDASFRGLNNTKMALDALLEDPELAARQGIDRTAHGVLNEVRQRLIRAMDNALGSQGSYQAGRQTYQTMSRDVVEPLEQAVAPLRNISPERGNLVRAAGALFDPQTRSPSLVAAARTAFPPDVWNDMLRVFMQKEGAKALKVMSDGETRNVAGGIAKAFDEATVNNLRAAMTPQQLQTFTELMDVFRAAARAVDTNSDTAFKLAARELAKRRDMGATAKTLEYLRPWDKIKAAQDFFAERNYARQAETIANIVTSGDRQALAQLRALRRYDASDYRRYIILGELLGRVTAEGAEAALD